MKSPLVSIIIPTFNRAHLICESLDSVLAQTYTNWECIVVDDGSRDDTEKLLKHYCEKDARFQYHQRPSNRPKGANACRNYGFEVSNGEYVKWLDSDDMLLKDAFEVQVKHLKLNLKIDVSIGLAKYYNGLSERTWIARPNKLTSDDIIYDYVIGEIYFATAGPLWRREYLEVRGELFNEVITKLQDTEFHYRMILSGLTFEFLDRELLLYRYGADDSITKNNSEQNFQSIFYYWSFVLKTAYCQKEHSKKKLNRLLINKISLLFYRMLIINKSIIKKITCTIRNRNIIFEVLKQDNLRWIHYLKIIFGIVLTIITNKGLRFFRIPLLK